MSSSTFTNIDVVNTYAVNLTQAEHTDIFVTSRGEALFGYAMASNVVTCIQMPTLGLVLSAGSQRGAVSTTTPNTPGGLPFKFEINQPNLVKRFWSGIKRGSSIGSASPATSGTGGVSSGSEQQFISFRFFQLDQSIYLMSLCKDFKIKIWCIRVSLLFSFDLQ